VTIAEALTNAARTWQGTSGMRMMPTDEFVDDRSDLNVAVAAGGHLVTVAYSWLHEGEPQTGLLVLNDADDAGGVQAVWADSFHQQPAWMTLHGTVTGSTVFVENQYAEDAKWGITVDATNPDELHLTMHHAYQSPDFYDCVRGIYTPAPA